MKAATAFSHLHCHSEFSLLDGLSRITELVEKAAGYNQEAIALTDHGNLHGAIYFYNACRSVGIKPILGLEAYVAPGSRLDKAKKKGEKAFHHITLLAKNMDGYKNLLRLSTESYMSGFYYKPRIDHDLLAKHSNGILCLSGCLSSALAKNILGGEDGLAIATYFRDVFGRDFYLEVQRTNSDGQDAILLAYQEIGRRLSIPLVATNDVHYTSKEDWRAHEALLCIGTGTHVNDKDRFKFDSQEYYLKSTDEMNELFYDVPEAIKNTQEIVQKCDLSLDFIPKKVSFPVPDEYVDAYQFLCKLCEYSKVKVVTWGEEHERRLGHELSVIHKLNFSDYILIVYDFVSWAKRRRIAIGGGRGSSAGSLVCYLLGITSVDPIKYNLVFERFINPERISPPDIDVDIEPDRRHEVIEYIKGKYANVIQIATFSTLKTKLAIRDCARVLQLRYGAGDAIAREVPDIWVDLTVDDAIKMPGFRRQVDYWITSEEQKNDFIDTTRRLEGKTKSLSTHAAGLIISSDPFIDTIPLCLGKDGEALSQYDMHSVEALGFVKFDLLGLKTVAVISEAANLAHLNIGGMEDDDAVYQMLCDGKTVGVFQYEGTSITKFVREFQPRQFEDLCLVNALYRPGPLDSGMARLYIERRNGGDRGWESSVHPFILPIVKDTHGIMVYQEQVMQLAVDVAGFSLGKADVLRKAMGKKDKILMRELREAFVNGAVEKGITRKTAIDLFRQTETFARYGWNRAHAVVYGLITYRTAFLKRHHPNEFFTALLNNEHDKTRQEHLIHAAKEHGVSIVRPHINVSDRRFVYKDRRVYQSISSIKGVGEKASIAILLERQNGPFKDKDDFRQRVPPRSVNSLVLKALDDNGAFRDLNYITLNLNGCSRSTLTDASLACMLGTGDRGLFLQFNGSILESNMKIGLFAVGHLESILGKSKVEVA